MNRAASTNQEAREYCVCLADPAMHIAHALRDSNLGFPSMLQATRHLKPGLYLFLHEAPVQGLNGRRW